MSAPDPYAQNPGRPQPGPNPNQPSTEPPPMPGDPRFGGPSQPVPLPYNMSVPALGPRPWLTVLGFLVLAGLFVVCLVSVVSEPPSGVTLVIFIIAVGILGLLTALCVFALIKGVGKTRDVVIDPQGVTVRLGKVVQFSAPWSDFANATIVTSTKIRRYGSNKQGALDLWPNVGIEKYREQNENAYRMVHVGHMDAVSIKITDMRLVPQLDSAMRQAVPYYSGVKDEGVALGFRYT